MITIFFIWALLTTPADRIICAMWLSKPPTQADMNAAGCYWTPTEAPLLILRAIEINTGKIACEQDADILPDITCNLNSLDNYRLIVIRPNYQELICTIKTSHEGDPTIPEIKDQCPIAPAQYELKLWGILQPDLQPIPICPMPQIQPGEDLFQMPKSAADLATQKPYAILAGRLIWTGMVIPDCDGWSGLDPITLIANTCGLQSAMSKVLEWQNQFDDTIYAAGQTVNIPPRLLKAIIGQESQFWPLGIGVAGEVGMMQLTDDGADIALRYSPELQEQYCPLAVSPLKCPAYALLSDPERRSMRDALRASMVSWNAPQEAAQKAQGTISTFARILASYYCYAGEVSGSPSWNAAAIAFHAGGECARMNCKEGVDYLERLRQ